MLTAPGATTYETVVRDQRESCRARPGLVTDLPTWGRDHRTGFPAEPQGYKTWPCSLRTAEHSRISCIAQARTFATIRTKGTAFHKNGKSASALLGPVLVGSFSASSQQMRSLERETALVPIVSSWRLFSADKERSTPFDASLFRDGAHHASSAGCRPTFSQLGVRRTRQGLMVHICFRPLVEYPILGACE